MKKYDDNYNDDFITEEDHIYCDEDLAEYWDELEKEAGKPDLRRRKTKSRSNYDEDNEDY